MSLCGGVVAVAARGVMAVAVAARVTCESCAASNWGSSRCKRPSTGWKSGLLVICAAHASGSGHACTCVLSRSSARQKQAGSSGRSRISATSTRSSVH